MSFPSGEGQMGRHPVMSAEASSIFVKAKVSHSNTVIHDAISKNSHKCHTGNNFLGNLEMHS